MSFNGDTDILDDDFETACAQASSDRKAGGGNLDKLPDGEHTFVVTGCEFKVGKMVIFELHVAVEMPDDRTYKGEKTYFLRGKDGKPDTDAIGRLKCDLKVLGFDVDKWSKELGRPFSDELKKLNAVVKGLKFKGKKVQNGKYVNVYVNARDEADGKPAVLDAAVIAEAALAGNDPF